MNQKNAGICGVVCAILLLWCDPGWAQPGNPLDRGGAGNPLDRGGGVHSGAATAAVAKFTRVGIHDPMVNNVEGAAMLVPLGWKLEGGFVWMFDWAIQANLIVRASDPQTGAAIEFLPVQQFSYATRDMGGLQLPIGGNWLGSCVLPPPRHPAELIYSFYSQALPHLQNVQPSRVDDLPRLAAEIKRTTRGAENTQLTVTRLRFDYSVGNQRWEEDVYLTITVAPDNGWNVQWWASGYANRAPAGQLDRLTPTLNACARSVRFSLDWTASHEYCRKLFVQGIKQHLADTARLGRMMMEQRAEINRMYQQVWEERDAARERQNFAFREVLGGIETYKDPYESRNVELPQGYKDYWVNSKGEYVLSEDQSFNPNVGSTIEWKKMDRYQP